MSNKNFDLENGRPFAAVAVIEGLETRDGDFNRVIQKGAVFTDQLPFPLLYGHDADEVIGRIDKFYTLADAKPDVYDRAVLESPDILQFEEEAVWIAEGYIATTARALEVQDLLDKRMLRGVSVGAGNNSVEEENEESEAYIFNQFQVIELSVTSMQAIGPAMAWLSDKEFVSVPEREKVLTKFSGTLNGAPIRPPSSFFDLPDEVPNAPTVYEDFRFCAYVGKHGVAHRGINGKDVYIPLKDDFAEYHLGNVNCEDGTRVSTGTISFNTTHSPLSYSGKQVQERYENTGTVGVDVVLHDNGIGVVACGAVRPNLSAADIRTLEAAPLSGEWRRGEEYLQTIFAVLQVNTPGYPVKASFDMEASFDSSEPKFEVSAMSGSFLDEDDRKYWAAMSSVAHNQELGELTAEEYSEAFGASEIKSRLDQLSLDLMKLSAFVRHNKR